VKNTEVRVLVADDSRSSREATAGFLRSCGFEVLEAVDGKDAARQLDDGVGVVVSDLVMPNLDGLGLLATVRERSLKIPLVMVTGHGSEEQAVRALKAGAFHYLTKPVNPDELLSLIQQAGEKYTLEVELANLRRRLDERGAFAGLVGRSPAMTKIFNAIRLVADAPTTVLVEGESGTGKELVARALHGESSRRNKPFVAVNCAALPESLIESELFGHEKGAFTGATARHAGTFQSADGGTLLVDEIGEMPLALQGRLLRVLETQCVTPVGSNREVPVDVRIVATTNRHLAERVKAGAFREDLYYRLNVVVIELPPLRERAGDVALLTRHFIDNISADTGRPVADITPAAMRCLERFAWPGNVRQLRNVLESMIVMATREILDVDDLPAAIRAESPLPNSAAGEAGSPELSGLSLEQLERMAIARALEDSGGNRTAAARLLGVSTRTIQRKIKKYGLE
jgi:two-component system response regulator HydG